MHKFAFVKKQVVDIAQRRRYKNVQKVETAKIVSQILTCIYLYSKIGSEIDTELILECNLSFVDMGMTNFYTGVLCNRI